MVMSTKMLKWAFKVKQQTLVHGKFQYKFKILIETAFEIY